MNSIFDTLVFVADTPIFLQVISHIKRKIAAGVLRDGDELPSRRKLAVTLSINPNTVQKIYKQLEDEGFLSNSQGAKSVLHITDTTRNTLQKELVGQELQKTLTALKESGVSLQEVLSLTQELWGTEPE